LEEQKVPNFAISDGSKIINVVVADSKEIVAEITGLQAFETNGQPWIDWTMEEEGWRRPSPYPSWIWNNEEWEAPTPMPSKEGYWYSWNENSLSWDENKIIIERVEENGN
jgi:hypothetical protein